MMEYTDTGVTKFAIGKPTEEERKQLEDGGYTLMEKGRNEHEPYEEYEIKDGSMKILKKLFCKHDYVFIRMLYGDEINVHNGKRHEYRCKKCGMHKWD